MRPLILSFLALLSAPALAGLGVPSLPAPVMAALQSQWPGFLLQEVEQEGANWEVEIKTADGKEIEVLLDASGTVLHHHDEADEAEIAVGDLPTAVAAAVASGWPDAALLEAEREGTAYEVEIRTSAGEHLEILLQADGTVIASSAEGEEDEGGDDDED